MKVKRIILIQSVLFLFFVSYAAACLIQEGSAECPNGGSLPNDFSGTATMSDGGSLTFNGKKYEFESGGSIIIDNGKVKEINKGKEVETESGTSAQGDVNADFNSEREHFDSADSIQRGTSRFTEVRNADFFPNGDYYIGSAASIEQEGIKIIKGIGIRYKNGEITADYAETFVKGNSISSNVDKLSARKQSFSVQSASKVVSGCNSFDNVKDSEFEIIGEDVKATAGLNVTLNITDCGYRDIEFESKGNSSSVTIKKDSYEISKGRLKCGSKDSIEAENTANVEVGSDCFTCLVVTPPGTYFYSDSDIRKDFSINIPKESSAYKLCLRKNQAQQFRAYNGLVDFADKKIELNGIVNYLRYPLKNNQISSLLGGFVYKGLKDVNALLDYDNDLLFLGEVSIKNTLKNKNDVTMTKPNNFYTIEEIGLEDGRVHRVVDLGMVSSSDETQSLISNYKSDSLDADVKIADGVLIQQKVESKVTILPPGHQKIGSFSR